MVKVAAPMLSLEASGTIANSMTFSKWKGRPYVRTRVTPALPGPQDSTRAAGDLRGLPTISGPPG